MEITVKRSQRKSITIKIDENGNVIIFCPKNLSNNNVSRIVEAKKQWIIKTQQKLLGTKKVYKDYYLYKKIFILGQSLEIKKEEKFLIIGNNQLKIIRNDIKTTLKNWLISKSEYIVKRIESLAKIYQFSYKTITIISAKKKWGGCDKNHNIRLNFKMLCLPKEYIDYICIHELSHTKHLNHSKNFYREIQKILPNYKNLQKGIKGWSFVLELF